MKTVYHRILLALIIAVYSISGFTQSTIRGQILDATSSDPLGFASVVLYESDSSLFGGVISDMNGEFIINEISAGDYYLVVQFMGYEAVSVADIKMSKTDVKILKPILLSPNQKLLDEIEISGERVSMISKVDRQVFDAGTFQSSYGGTAVDVLRNLPSVAVNANGEITARGSSGFVVMINGKPLQTDPVLILNQLPANAIKNVEVITAPSAKYDPEGKAGIINIITEKTAVDGIFFQVNTKMGFPSIENYDNAEYAQRYGADFTINYNKDKWNISFGGSFLRNDLAGRREGNVYTVVSDTVTRFPSDGERSFDDVSYAGRFTVGYTPNKKNDFNVGFYAGKRSKDRTADILYYDNHATYEGSRAYTFQYFNENLRIRKGDFVLGSVDYAHHFQDESRVTTSLLYEYTLLGGPTTNLNLAWPNTEIVLQDEYNTNNNPLHGVRYELDYKSPVMTFGTLEAGYQFRNLDHTGDFVYERRNNTTGMFELIPDFSSEVNLHRLIHSGYLQLSGEKGKWTYSAGVRMEFMDRSLLLKDKAGLIDTMYRYDFAKPFPSASMQYELKDDIKIKAAYSRRVERTTTFKMNPFPEREHSETLEQGDPELRPEFIDLIELGMVKDFGESSIYATAYLRNVKNVVNRVNTIYNDTILNRIYSNVGIAQSLGLEVGTDLQITEWWKAFLSGNIYDYQIEGSFNAQPVNSSSMIYSINANTTFNLPNKWSVQGLFNFISARNTAQGEDSRFYNPSLTVQKSFLDNRLVATFQWLNMDLGILKSNEQAITTSRPGDFYTYTNYVYEVDRLMLNLSFSINSTRNKAKFIKSEFGEKEF